MTMQSDVFSNPSSGTIGAVKSQVLTALAKNRILVFIVLSYLAVGQLISTAISTPFDSIQFSSMKWMLLASTPIFIGSMIIWRFAHMIVNVRPTKPIGWLARDLRDMFFRDRKRLLSGVVAVTCVVYFAAAFSFIKESIPLLNPFSWDPTFAEWDRLLHGGVDPYILLAPVFGNPLMTKLADSAYSLWILLVYFFSFTACMDTDNPRRRTTFLCAFFLTWIIGGTILAILLSSVGPVYYEAFGHGDQFLPLMNSLKEFNEIQPLTALELQAMLLDGYQNDGGIKGISAMPSMHVAMSWVIAFHTFQFRRALGWLMVGFAVLIQFSSVHLGWHYAIDGYLGFVVAVVCWLIAKRLASLQSWFDNRSQG